MENNSVYRIVTERILDRLIVGDIPWRDILLPKKGQKAAFSNPATGTNYSTLNCLLLGIPGEYCTFNQIKARGGKVRKGAQSHLVTYWSAFIPKDKKDEADRLEAEGKSTDHLKQQVLRYYRVFNLNDVEDMKPFGKGEAAPAQKKAEDPTDIANMVLLDYKVNEGVEVKDTLADEASYDPVEDSVRLPAKERFIIEEDWFASLFSGLVHSTATKKRANRETEMKKMLEGEVTAKEALIAEIGSSMILTACGLKRKETHQQIDAVCKKWIDAMNRDYRLIVYASSGAEKAAQYILGQFAA